LTDFRFGGYVVVTNSGSWSTVWIALFPTGKPGRFPGEQAGKQTEIMAVLESSTIHNEADLRQLMQARRVVGLCSNAPRSSWGTELGPKLRKANPGSDLSSAWLIEELREPPSEAKVRGLFLASSVCYLVAIALALVVFARTS
jgi:hypothetical protein